MASSALPLETHRAEESTAIAPADQTALMFERLAKDPAVDVDKLERLIAMQERIMLHNAKAEFYADFAQMQAALPTVSERGLTNNGAYATHEDIIEAVRPVLQRFGFIVTHRTFFPDVKTVRVVGVLAHRGGHSEETEFVASPDTSGNKNSIQALGSAQSYGQRYTTRALLNIASRKDDDDGKKAGGKPKVEEPDGFADRWADLIATADNGTRRLEEAWKGSPADFKNYVLKERAKAWNDLKAKASRVAAS